MKMVDQKEPVRFADGNTKKGKENNKDEITNKKCGAPAYSPFKDFHDKVVATATKIKMRINIPIKSGLSSR
jgi:hypothetical protein